VKGLKVELCAQLVSARVTGRAGRLAEIGVVPVACCVTTQVVVIQDVEDIEGNPECCQRPPEAREILAKPEVHILVWESTRCREAATLVCISAGSFTAETSGASDVLPDLATQCHQAGELNPE